MRLPFLPTVMPRFVEPICRVSRGASARGFFVDTHNIYMDKYVAVEGDRAMTYWGVDSWNMADEPVGRSRRSLFETVSRWAGEPPDFWGRYIGKQERTRTPPLTRREAEFIFGESGRATKVLVIYNGAGPADFRAGERAGARHAEIATQWARYIGAPRGTRIYLNIEPVWFPTAGFFLGWWRGMKASPYAGMGGVYANPDFVYISRPYVEALQALSAADRYCWTRYHWSTRPTAGPLRGQRLDALPFRPRRLGNLRASLREVLDETPWNDATVLWQFARNCQCGSGAPIVDLNLADAFGYRDLWAWDMRARSAARTAARRAVAERVGSAMAR